MVPLLALLFTIVTPAVSTDWMRPESFHLVIGMKRADAVGALHAWNPKPGKDASEVVVDYASDKSLTLEFRKERLHAIRFELFVLLPQARQAFEEHRAFLKGKMGEPRKATKSVLIYDNALPNDLSEKYSDAGALADRARQLLMSNSSQQKNSASS